MTVSQEEVKVTEVVSKQAPPVKTEKVSSKGRRPETVGEWSSHRF